MGIEILYNPDYYLKEEEPKIKTFGKIRDKTCNMKFGIEIITSKKRIRIFIQ